MKRALGGGGAPANRSKPAAGNGGKQRDQAGAAAGAGSSRAGRGGAAPAVLDAAAWTQGGRLPGDLQLELQTEFELAMRPSADGCWTYVGEPMPKVTCCACCAACARRSSCSNACSGRAQGRQALLPPFVLLQPPPPSR